MSRIKMIAISSLWLVISSLIKLVKVQRIQLRIHRRPSEGIRR